jgi:hypothetical protein
MTAPFVEHLRPMLYLPVLLSVLIESGARQIVLMGRKHPH